MSELVEYTKVGDHAGLSSSVGVAAPANAVSNFIPVCFHTALVLFLAGINWAATIDGNATILMTPHFQHHLKEFLYNIIIKY